MTLLEKLKEALKKKGLDEGLANIVKIENESEIEGIVNSLASTQSGPQELDFSEVIKSEDFNKFFEKHGFDGLLKLNTKLQSEHDKRVTKGIQTRLEKFLKTKEDGSEGDDPKPTDVKKDDMPEWAKTLMQKIEGIEQEKSTQTKKEKAVEAFGKSKLPEKLQQKWLNRIDLENEDYDAQIKGLEEEYTELQKELGGSRYAPGLPMGGGDVGKVSDDEIESITELMN